MNKSKSAKKPAKKSKNPSYYLTPLLPGNSNIGSLKDFIQTIVRFLFDIQSFPLENSISSFYPTCWLCLQELYPVLHFQMLNKTYFPAV